MAKLFGDVFPNLVLADEEGKLFETASVEHIRYSPDHRGINVYLTSDRLLEKKSVFYLEEEIKKQLFPNDEMEIHVYERMILSRQYNLTNLLESYKDSILLEIKRASEVDYNLLRKAEWITNEGDGDTLPSLTIRAESGIFLNSRCEDIKNHLRKVFAERCGIETTVKFEFKESETVQLPYQEDELFYDFSYAKKRRTRHTESGEGAGTIVSASGGDADLPWDDSAPKAPAAKTAAPQTGKGNGSGDAAQSNTSGTNSGNNGGFQKKKEFTRRTIQRDPSCLYGNNVEGDITQLVNIQTTIGEVVIHGDIINCEERQLNSGKVIFTIGVTDYTDSIRVKLFAPQEDVEEIRNSLVPGKSILVKGDTVYDKFDRELEIGMLKGIKMADSIKKKRVDHSEEKRVELHLHTQMSEFDGVSDVADMIKMAKSWGHKAMAVTDHGVAYSFPLALHALSKDDDFKMIYGVEGYLVDDMKQIVENLPEDEEKAAISLNATAVVFDLETTGFSAKKNTIIEFGAVKVKDGKIVDRFSTFVNPKIPIPFRIENLTGIRDDMVMNSPTLDEILPQFLDFCSDAEFLVAHNANFDVGFVENNVKTLLGKDYKPVYLDTVSLARYALPPISNYKLDTVAKHLKLPPFNHHRAVDDAEETALIFLEFVKILEHQNITDLKTLQLKGIPSEEMIKKMPTYHIILIAQNEIGRINLYHLISDSHLKYFRKQPRIPRSEIMKRREGIIVGSACEAGELFQSVVRGESGEIVSRIVNFYDYLEIQPIGNNMFMLDVDGNGVDTEEDLRDLNRQIVALGEQFNKPVVATCDVHFLNPEDEIYRRIIQAGKGFQDADKQAPLYLRTTDEMLAEFDYLGQEKAYEVVIKNTNLIADMCEKISPVRPDKCPPVIPDSDNILRNLCYETAHSIYGPDLPEIVSKRLEKELNSIISNGFAVMYIIAQKLVKKSNDDGYLVGSRGSVGSSFVATMSGITEVNPLPPHYLCNSCYYVDFDSPEVKAHGGGAGCDMPDKLCPNCGKKLAKMGFDIPFETFLGFKGDKEPDIDLNFSGEYQSKAHDYTEVIFGAGQTFRAGTIGTLADKTAYGYVANYYLDHGIEKRDIEIERVALGCTGIRRTTGQHPGGIVVLPVGEDICSFTPIQHPANDMETPTITTHFEYHSIDHNLLKLDILGHDDPTMIKMLEELTGMDMKTVPLDSPEVMSLFMNTSALGITPDDIMGCQLGALGIPEFGTDFAMGMLIEAAPTKFSDLVRIAGLSHGTDVWLNNAQTLIQNGICDISTAICTRDDIMIYLISMGVESEQSFKIMEAVRKGTVAKGKCDKWEGWKADMIAHGVPQWYIESCEKIKYMFPKAHAAAYVMMAWRIAYCKVFYPLAYYAAYFSIRATAFSYDLMCKGREHLEAMINDYKARKDTLSNKEQDELRDMRVVQEMYARGFQFAPVDLFLAKASRFQIIDGKIMPSFKAIDGLGDSAAETIEIAAMQGEFLSHEDFRERAKVGTKVVEKLLSIGLLQGLPESNQISLFDF